MDVRHRPGNPGRGRVPAGRIAGKPGPIPVPGVPRGMSDYVIAPPVIAALPILGSAQMFPVRRIFCVGRNYAEHAIEMGSDPTREPPFYFTKPADALVVNDADMPY